MVIFTGSGYQTVILAEICQKVFSIERIKTLAKKGKNIADKINLKEISLIEQVIIK